MSHHHCGKAPCRGSHYHSWHGSCRAPVDDHPRWHEHSCGGRSWDAYSPHRYCDNYPIVDAEPSSLAPLDVYDVPSPPPAEAPAMGHVEKAPARTEDEKDRTIDKLSAVVTSLAAKIDDLEKRLEQKGKTKKYM